ncbi:MAG: hypothetical protein P8Y67_14110 [Alphaproteobacteria bacterium]|jgi:hypothetical protein
MRLLSSDMKYNATTIAFARIIAVYFCVTGLGFVISPDFFAKLATTTESDPVLINLSGMVHFFIGMTMLAFHFKWRRPLEIAVSVLSLLYLLKGIALIMIPELTLQTGGNAAQTSILMPSFFLGVGITLGAFAFLRKQE